MTATVMSPTLMTATKMTGHVFKYLADIASNLKKLRLMNIFPSVPNKRRAAKFGTAALNPLLFQEKSRLSNQNLLLIRTRVEKNDVGFCFINLHYIGKNKMCCKRRRGYAYRVSVSAYAAEIGI